MILRGDGMAEFYRQEKSLFSLAESTKRLVFAVPYALAATPEFQDYAMKFRFFAICVGFPLPIESGFDYAGRAANSTFSNSIIDSMKLLFTQYTHVKLIPELELGEDFASLGQTLMALAELDRVPWISLRPRNLPNLVAVKKLRDIFEYLEMRNFPEKEIYFAFDCPEREEWKLKTSCYFSGPNQLDLDLTNRCTHNCVFCGLYSPIPLAEARSRNNGELPLALREVMKQELPFEKAKEILDSLPEQTQTVLFGGAGDPLLHKHAMELIRIVREKNIDLYILSNLDYLDEAKAIELSRLGGKRDSALHITVNLSAASAQTYQRIRPNQRPEKFEQILKTVRILMAEKKRNHGVGVYVTLMSVVQAENFADALEFVKLGQELEVDCVYLKPMEIHSAFHRKLLPTGDLREPYESALQAAVRYAKDQQVNLKFSDDLVAR